MGSKQRDCVGCGAPVGLIDRDYCCYCMRAIRLAASKAPCPGCGKDRLLDPVTGRCVLCSRRCGFCGGPVRAAGASTCRPCQRRAERESAKAPCPRCGRLGVLREETGWCGICSRPREAKAPPRICQVCGQLRRHAALGMCSACWQRNADRPVVRADKVATNLSDPPPWLPQFTFYLAARHCPARAATMISTLGRLLTGNQSHHPQAVLERSRQPGRSMGSLARALEGFFIEHHLALPTDQTTDSPPVGAAAASRPSRPRCVDPSGSSPTRC